MIFWIVVAVFLLILSGIAISLGTASAEKKLTLKASALQERAKREFPSHAITQIGPSEFVLLYRKAETKRRFPEKLGPILGMMVFAAIALSIFPLDSRDASLAVMAAPALTFAGMIPGGIIGTVIAKGKGEVWMLNKMEEIHTR